MDFLFPNSKTHAVVTYLVKAYNERGKKPLGRTILQKLCYFTKANGVELPVTFQIHHYGPFSQELFNVVDNLRIDGVIEDDSEHRQSRSDYKLGPNAELLLNEFSDQIQEVQPKLDSVVDTFKELNPTEMELVSTVHYVASSSKNWFKKPLPRSTVVKTVMEIKGSKFEKRTVARIYDILEKAGLLD